jgi:hypothetical protein
MKKQRIILIVSFLFVSCTKNTREPDWIKINTEILTSGVWQFSDYKYDGYTYVTYANLPACRQDDLRSFNRDGTGETNEGATKCNSTDPQSQQVQWRFLTKYANTIELSGDEYYIDQLDDHEFKFHKKHLDPYAPEISYGYSR